MGALFQFFGAINQSSHFLRVRYMEQCSAWLSLAARTIYFVQAFLHLDSEKNLWRSGLRRAHFPETNFQLEYPGEGFFSTLDSISWGICQAAIHNSLQRLAVLFELRAAPSLAGTQELRWCLIAFFYTETEAILVHSFNDPKGSYSNIIANLWLGKNSEKPNNKIDNRVILCTLYVDKE